MLEKGRSKNCTIYFSLILTFFVKAGETTAGEMMAGDNEPSQNDDDLDIVNEDTNQGTLSYFKIIKTILVCSFQFIRKVLTFTLWPYKGKPNPERSAR